MSPFKVPDGPFTLDMIMDAIRKQVIEHDENLKTGAKEPESARNATTQARAREAVPFAESLNMLARRLETEPEYRIQSHRKFVGKFVDPIKRLIHWGSRPYVDLVRRRQEEWNAATLCALLQMADYFDARHEAFARETEEKVQDLTHRLRDARASLGAFYGAIPASERLDAMDRDRGTYEDIRERQTVYVDHFRGLPGQVLDVGCGRGELLGVLRNEGIECWGADTDPLMLEITRVTGVIAVQADAIGALKSVAPASLGGIFAAQVIEHLFIGELLEFLQLARERLAPGGVMILETVNPGSLGAMSKSFWRDMDHKQPVHPATLTRLLSQLGFDPVEVHPIHPFGEKELPPKLPSAQALGVTPEAHAALSRRFDVIEALLFGEQDYYVVARQPKASAAQASEGGAQ